MTVRVLEHAPFPPSGMATTVQCPGSWKLQALYPARDDTEAAADGVAAHWVVAQGMTGKLPDVDTIAPNGVPVTDEMLDGAELYMDAVGIHADNAIEERLPASDYFGEDCWGTPDTYRFKSVPPGGVLLVADYKFGHRFVDVFENWQLMTYASLVLDKLGIAGDQEQHIRVVFKIIQPRCYDPRGPVREWSVLATDLRAYWNKINAAISLARSEQAQCWVGKECRDCSASAHCPSLHRAAQSLLDEVSKPTPIELPPDALGYQLRKIKRAVEILEARKSGLEEVTLEKLKGGQFVPGFMVGRGQGRARWKIPVAQIDSMGQLMNMKLTEPKPVTPKQAIKLGLPADLVNEFSETPAGKLMLVEDDGKLAEQAFGGKK